MPCSQQRGMPDSEVLGPGSEGVQLYTMGFKDGPGQQKGGKQTKPIKLILQVFTYCGPEKESCVGNQTLADKGCLVPCTGLYADIADDSLKQTKQAAFEQNLMKGKMWS